MAACGGDEPSANPTPDASETAPCVPAGTALEIAAKAIEFDRNCLAAPANQPFTIAFDNQEAIPHDLGIYPDSRNTAALFQGERVAGPTVKTYNVPALAAGDYHFRCSIHPQQMQGDFVVR